MVACCIAQGQASTSGHWGVNDTLLELYSAISRYLTVKWCEAILLAECFKVSAPYHCFAEMHGTNIDTEAARFYPGDSCRIP